MKKILSVLVLFSVISGFSIAAFATQDITNINGSQNADVFGTYQAGTSDVIYSVDISWSALSFTYNAADRVWDPTTHSYIENGGDWANSDGQITVINHSNASITAKPTWIADQGFESAIMTFDCAENGLYLQSAAESNSEVSGIIKVIPTGYLTEAANGGRIGQITVTIIGQTASNDDQIIDTEPVYVMNEDELETALTTGKKIILGDNITVNKSLTINSDVSVDLNQYTLTLFNEMSVSEGNLNISNGTIDGILSCNGGSISLNYDIVFYDQNNDDIRIGLAVNNGYATCNFDPGSYVLLGSATDNGNGTWTVTPN